MARFLFENKMKVTFTKDVVVEAENEKEAFKIFEKISLGDPEDPKAEWDVEDYDDCGIDVSCLDD